MTGHDDLFPELAFFVTYRSKGKASQERSAWRTRAHESHLLMAKSLSDVASWRDGEKRRHPKKQRRRIMVRLSYQFFPVFFLFLKFFCAFPS